MEKQRKYPTDDEIKVEWTWVHKLFIVSTISSIWLGYYLTYDNTLKVDTLFTLSGYTFDIVGVTVAALKTPFYGIFFDGGDIEDKRSQVERKYFQVGMLLIGIGIFLQALGTLFAK